MNTSTNTNQIHDTSKADKPTTPTGFRCRTMAGALLVMTLAASAVGFAAMSHADDETQIPGTDITISAPAPAPAPPPPPPAPPLTPWLEGLMDWALHPHPHLHCGHRGIAFEYSCDWY
jgi:hypothetical protein